MAKTCSSYERTLQAIARDYRRTTGVEEMNLDDMFSWAIENHLYDPAPVTLRRRFKREMSRALGRETLVDPQGRTIKANHAYRVAKDGHYEWDWAPIEKIRPSHMQISLTLRRDSMVATVLQHNKDWGSYNDNNVHGAQLPKPEYNFNPDIQESEESDEYPG